MRERWIVHRAIQGVNENREPSWALLLYLAVDNQSFSFELVSLTAPSACGTMTVSHIPVAATWPPTSLPDHNSKVYGDPGCPGRPKSLHVLAASRPAFTDNLIHELCPLLRRQPRVGNC